MPAATSSATAGGGGQNEGTIFEVVNGSGTITTLGTFTNLGTFASNNGSRPFGGVIEDSSGNLFGTTELAIDSAGDETGNIFELAHGSSTITVLANFVEGGAGYEPTGGLYEDSNGNLFGTTTNGPGAGHDGSVVELAHGSGTITELAGFNGANGDDPVGSLVADSNGDLFGVTNTGGANNVGTVFEVAALPRITSLNPTSTNQAGPSFTLTVNGTSFQNPSTVQWNGASLATTWVSSTQLQAVVPAADLAAYGSASITVSVFNAEIGADLTSAAVPFTILDAPLTAGTVNASGGVMGVTATNLTATFSDANQNAPISGFSGTIHWGDGTTSSFTSSSVTGSNGNYTVTGSYQYASPGIYNISVTVNDVGGSTTTITGSTTVAIIASAGYYAPVGSPVQFVDPAGTYSTAGAVAPTTDPAGTFSAAGAAAPMTDPVGTYSSAGAAAPTPASPGYYVAVTGASSETPASPGSYVPTSGASSPTPASPGYYVPGSAATAQIQDPAGTFSGRRARRLRRRPLQERISRPRERHRPRPKSPTRRAPTPPPARHLRPPTRPAPSPPPARPCRRPTR